MGRNHTIDDAKEVSELISLLMGTQVEPRRNFICENANYADIDQ